MMKTLITGSRWGEDATIIRQQPGTRDSSDNFVPGAATETAIKVVSVPLGSDPERITRLPIGARLEDHRIFYVPTTDVDALSVGAGQQASGDVIMYQGIKWVVDSVELYHVGGFAEVVGIRAQGQDG